MLYIAVSYRFFVIFKKPKGGSCWLAGTLPECRGEEEDQRGLQLGADVDTTRARPAQTLVRGSELLKSAVQQGK